MIFIAKKIKKAFSAFAAGVLNGLLGTGGGVPLWFAISTEKDRRTAYATASVGILVLSAVSLFLHFEKSGLPSTLSPLFLWAALFGGACGAFLLNKVPLSFLRFLFAFLLILSGGIVLIRIYFDGVRA